jgi:hypothetical protein
MLENIAWWCDALANKVGSTTLETELQQVKIYTLPSSISYATKP